MTPKHFLKNNNNNKTKKNYKKPNTGGSSNISNYLSKTCLFVDIQNTNMQNFYKELQNNILNKSFNNDYKSFFDNFKQNIETTLPTSVYKKDFEKKDWLSCEKECLSTATTAMNLELNSTAYMLRILANTLIGIDKDSSKLIFIYTGGDNGNKLSGVWKNDKDFFKIHKIGKNDITSSIDSRLIMGLGPSASGKTYWTKNIITLLNKNVQNFPSSFFSIDGGDYRELSKVYQTIIESIKKKRIGGISNLVLSNFSLSQKSIFDSNIVKKNIINFLKESNFNISLYVPETLGDCGAGNRLQLCSSKINKYKEVTKDQNWIALLIYQHKTDEECPYDFEYQCIGTTNSGKSRETTEGKQFSSKAWQHSMNHGKTEINRSPNLRFIIHNTGGKTHNNIKNKSLFMDMSIKSPFNTLEKQLQIEKDYNCKYESIKNIVDIK